MVSLSALPMAQPPAVRPSVRLPAWLEVAKPRLIPLLLATTLAGMAVSGSSITTPVVLCTLLGGALASAAAGVLNCLWEQELDGRMQRTSRRALPSGRLAQRQAFGLAVALTLVSVTVLVLGVNPLAASLALLGLCSYVLLYTALLKPRTPQNIVIGGVAGAIPALVGAAAASGELGASSWWLFSLVMVWTPAHFWALALLLKDDYRSVGIPMLPVVKGVQVTARAISSYAWLTVALSLLGAWMLPSGGLFYGLLVLPFNGRLLQLVSKLSRNPNDPSSAKALFRWSIFYLFGVSLLLLMARLPQAEPFSIGLGMLPTLGG
ncbi:protoheme IX farnesyltransferase [Cyanobium sp. LEGE 06143]|uniref:heme o synthase n=1 Tax=unclassified Cyanobium TaxID=2627006 RepID=UPI001646D15D|nr:MULTISPECIES: heme o synthase [unclassified Cyanobium]MBE9173936.1 protoheme IX farnesyltransferase [Cyanobium sp. LEGE 06143]